MRWVHTAFVFAAAVLTAIACSRGASSAEGRQTADDVAAPATREGAADAGLAEAFAEAAERGRREPYALGSGFAESAAREQAGDYAGAALACYRDLLYARGLGLLGDDEVEERLESMKAASLGLGGLDEDGQGALDGALRAASAFHHGDWAAVRAALADCPDQDPEYDSLRAFMSAVATLELRQGGEATRSAFSAMQARYRSFPEYWIRAARLGDSVSLRRDAAERCIALASEGPYAAEARGILAVGYGLELKDASSLLTISEIDSIASAAALSGTWGALSALFPLLALKDNPCTLYGLDSLKALARDAGARDWLDGEASRSTGRLAERLRYAAGR